MVGVLEHTRPPIDKRPGAEEGTTADEVEGVTWSDDVIVISGVRVGPSFNQAQLKAVAQGIDWSTTALTAVLILAHDGSQEGSRQVQHFLDFTESPDAAAALADLVRAARSAHAGAFSGINIPVQL